MAGGLVGGEIIVRVTVWSGISEGGYPCRRGAYLRWASLPCCRFATWLAPFASLHYFVKQARGLVAAWEFNTFPQDEDGNISLPCLHPANSALYNTIRRKKKSIDSPSRRSTITALSYSKYNICDRSRLGPGAVALLWRLVVFRIRRMGRRSGRRRAVCTGRVF